MASIIIQPKTVAHPEERVSKKPSPLSLATKPIRKMTPMTIPIVSISLYLFSKCTVVTSLFHIVLIAYSNNITPIFCENERFKIRFNHTTESFNIKISATINSFIFFISGKCCIIQKKTSIGTNVFMGVYYH